VLHVSVVFHPIIAEIVRAYRETHPDVRLSPSESNVAALIDDLLAVSMVAAGFGLSIVPESSRQVAATGVTYHAIDGPGPKAQIVIAYRSTEFSKVVRDFLEVARRLTKNRHHDSA
jgi:DNA-binding transcriptional LysR family regulator